MSSTVRRLRKTYGSIKAVIKGATVGRTKAIALRFTRKLVDAGVSTRTGKVILEGVTAGKQVLMKTILRVRLGREVVGDLTDAEQRFLGEVVKRSDADGVRGLKQLHEDGTFDGLLEVGACTVRSAAGASVSMAGIGTTAGPANLAALSTVQSCPADLAGIDEDTMSTVISRLSKMRDNDEITANELSRIEDGLKNGDIDGEDLIELAEAGDDDAARFISRLDPEAPEGELSELQTYLELADDADIPRDRLEAFAQVAGEKGALLVKRLDTDELKAFFEIEAENINPTTVRKRLAEYASGNLDVSSDEVGQFAKDVRELDSEGLDVEEAYYKDIINEVNEGNVKKVKGDIGEARAARKLVNSDTDTVEGLEVEDKVEFTNVDGNTVTRRVEIDIQTRNSLVEVKYGGIDRERVVNQIRKYKVYRDDPNQDIVIAVSDKDALSESLRNTIKDEGARIVEIDNLPGSVGQASINAVQPNLAEVPPTGPDEPAPPRGYAFG